MTLDHIVVVGASLAGFRAAEALRGGGYGGRLTIVGAERHFPPIDRPPMSKQLLSGTYSAERARLAPLVDLGKRTDLLLGDIAVGVDPHHRELTLHSGRGLAFDALVVATGSRPRLLPGQPELEGVLTLRTLEDSQRLRDHLVPGARAVIVGAGFIGTEATAAAVGRGVTVTLVDELSLPLERACGPVIGAFVRELHARHGVSLRLGQRVKSIDGGTHVSSVTFDDGSLVPADVVVVGIGSTPNTDWLHDSGLPVSDGLVCDSRLLVDGFPYVAAAGDVARWVNPMYGRSMRVEHWTNAVEQAAAAAASLLAGTGAAQSYSSIPYVWSDQYDTKIQILGLTTADFTELHRDDTSLAGVYLEEAGQVVGAACVGRPALTGRLRRLVADARDRLLAVPR